MDNELLDCGCKEPPILGSEHCCDTAPRSQTPVRLMARLVTEVQCGHRELACEAVALIKRLEKKIEAQQTQINELQQQISEGK